LFICIVQTITKHQQQQQQKSNNESLLSELTAVRQSMRIAAQRAADVEQRRALFALADRLRDAEQLHSGAPVADEPAR
jgi:hypothetical protein